MMTPDFPLWGQRFDSECRRLRKGAGQTLHQLETLFGSWIPHFRLAQQEAGPHSRQRDWPLRLVFWTFLWQVAQAGTACREAIRQAQCLCRLRGHTVPADEDSPYCQARGKLPLDRLDEIQRAVIDGAEEAIAAKDLWCELRVKVVDASTLTLEDTPKNQAAYPQPRSQKPGCGFPIMRLIGLFSLATGLFTAWATGTWSSHELVLLQALWDSLAKGDVLLGDRGFGIWSVLAQCLARQVAGVFRVRGRRRSDWRRGKRLSKNERLVEWAKPRNRPAYIDAKAWALLPEMLTLRLVRVIITEPGYRTRKVTLVTTLLDSKKYPPAALAQLYRRRWDMELSLRHLKTTLQMEHLSCKTPENVERELQMHLLMHNLVRRLMFEAARKANVPLSRISFAGALAAARRTGEAMLQARNQTQRGELIEDLYRVLAKDLVPERPGRWEPRAVKRRPKPYPALTRPRSRFREISHRNRYWANGPSKRKGPKYVRAN
jgi:hypothetical protein